MKRDEDCLYCLCNDCYMRESKKNETLSNKKILGGPFVAKKVIILERECLPKKFRCSQQQKHM